MLTIGPLIVLGAAVLMVVALFLAGVAGLRGRQVWLPTKSGIGGVTARGRAARYVGAVLVLLSIFVAILLVRAFVAQVGT